MYEALYRKYRPKTFDDVAGQDYITETLKNQVRSGRLSHAYLFIGTRGTGKTTCARILAKAVNCEHPINGNPCCECAACRGIEDGSIMDVVELDAASNNGVDDVRMLRDEAIFSPVSVRKRVYIIDEVHMLSKPAFNALLKILEEPPEHLMFILATTELNKVLPTILSRCQRHSFRRLDGDTVAKRLLYVAGKEGIELREEAAQLLGRLADGAMRDGLSLLDQCSSAEVIDTEAVLRAMGLAGSYRIRSLADCVMRCDASAALTEFESLWQDGKEPASLLAELASFFRDVLLLRLAPQGGRELTSGAYGADVLRSVTLDDSSLLWVLNTLQKYQSGMLNTANARLQGELCLAELCGMQPGEAATASVVRPAKPVTPPKYEKEEKPPVAEAEEVPPPPEEEAPPEKETFFEAAPQSAVSETLPPSGTNGDEWKRFLDEVIESVPIGTRFILTDPQQVQGDFGDTELVLRVADGFARTAVNTPELINKLRTEASRVRGHGVQLRVESLRNEAALRTDKLSALEQFGNVTIN